MPKIEVNESLFFDQLGKRYDYDTLEKLLTCAKAELDEKADESLPKEKRILKFDLNDTNRPDLWSTMGTARQLNLYNGKKQSDYSSFMSTFANMKDTGKRVVTVDKDLKDVRPYMVAFVISGKKIDEPLLKDIIQTQEKLCSNYGRKRKTISMGVYRSSKIKWPVHYKAVDPDKTSFVPLQCTQQMTCRQILSCHPKGKDYGWILKDCKKFPLLTDDTGEVMSMAPIINSATLGAVQVGDTDLLVELTGSQMQGLMLSSNIVACDFFDAGFEILPVKVCHPYETGFGKDITTPFYFQKPTTARLFEVNKKLGVEFSKDQVIEALLRMGNTVSAKEVATEVSTKEEKKDVVFELQPPPYRDDFLHEVDVIEDVMIGAGLDTFIPEEPKDFTIGRLLPVTQFSRLAKSTLAGLGYQEMIFNYLGSKKDYIEKMNVPQENVIEIANPMSENYQFVRPSIIPSLLKAETVSMNAIFPHKTFEIGKIAFIDALQNTGTITRQSLGLLYCNQNASFNTLAADISTLLYYLGHKYQVKEAKDARFIEGRQALIVANGKEVGIFGELHPQVLQNWQIAIPCVAGEIDLEALM